MRSVSAVFLGLIISLAAGASHAVPSWVLAVPKVISGLKSESDASSSYEDQGFPNGSKYSATAKAFSEVSVCTLFLCTADANATWSIQLRIVDPQAPAGTPVKVALAASVDGDLDAFGFGVTFGTATCEYFFKIDGETIFSHTDVKPNGDLENDCSLSRAIASTGKRSITVAKTRIFDRVVGDIVKIEGKLFTSARGIAVPIIGFSGATSDFGQSLPFTLIVPEPSTALLLGLGLVGLAARRVI